MLESRSARVAILRDDHDALHRGRGLRRIARRLNQTLGVQFVFVSAAAEHALTVAFEAGMDANRVQSFEERRQATDYSRENCATVT